MNVYADRIKRLGSENAFKIGDDIRRCEQMGMKVAKLNLGESDFNTPRNINQVAVENIESGNSNCTDPQRILPLREFIARYVLETRGVRIDPQQVVVTEGAKPPI